VVLNADDASYLKLKNLVPARCRLLSYSLASNSPTLTAARERFPEIYNQANCLAAAVMCHELKVNKSVTLAAIKTFPGVPGRMEVISNHRGLKIVVDFAHTPNGLSQALKALRQTTSGRLIAVFGAAGLRDASKRPLMGKIGSELADEVVLTAEDPRTENVRVIIRQLKEGIVNHHGHMHAYVDRRQAIGFALLKLSKRGDTVGIFGKGHERSMNLDGRQEQPWSDQQTVREVLTSL
jgi:UDP-N-acetylmuramyl tripeptide synthase